MIFIYQGADFSYGSQRLTFPLTEDELPYWLEIYFKHSGVSIRVLEHIYKVVHSEDLPTPLFVTSYSFGGTFVRKKWQASNPYVQYSEDESSLQENLRTILHGDDCLF